MFFLKVGQAIGHINGVKKRFQIFYLGYFFFPIQEKHLKRGVSIFSIHGDVTNGISPVIIQTVRLNWVRFSGWLASSRFPSPPTQSDCTPRTARYPILGVQNAKWKRHANEPRVHVKKARNTSQAVSSAACLFRRRLKKRTGPVLSLACWISAL